MFIADVLLWIIVYPWWMIKALICLYVWIFYLFEYNLWTHRLEHVLKYDSIRTAAIDPADWSHTCDTVRTELVSREPYQVTSVFTFSKCKDGRSCSSSLSHHHLNRELVNGEKARRGRVQDLSRKDLYCFCKKPS